MTDELNKIDMKTVPISFGSTYLNVPGGDCIEYNKKLINLVETLGEEYGVISGSNLKKGIHFIQKEIGNISKREIKMMLRNVSNSVIHNPNETIYVYRCSKKHYTEIFKFIVEKSNFTQPQGSTCSDFLIKKPKIGIRYVSAHAENDQIKNIASNMIEELDSI